MSTHAPAAYAADGLRFARRRNRRDLVGGSPCRPGGECDDFVFTAPRG